MMAPCRALVPLSETLANRGGRAGVISVMRKNASGGRVVVSSSKEYREFTEKCLEWAAAARTAGERKIFMEMAQTWLQVANLLGQRAKRNDADVPGT